MAKKAKKGHKRAAHPLRVVTYQTSRGDVTKRVRGGVREAVNRAPQGTQEIMVSGTKTVRRAVHSGARSVLIHRFVPFGKEGRKACWADAIPMKSGNHRAPVCVGKGRRKKGARGTSTSVEVTGL